MGQIISARGRKIHGVQSDIIRTLSQTSHPIRESDIDTLPKGLLKLPTELILEIADYLPPVAYISLSYSCRRIRNCMGASIEHLLGDKLPLGRQSATALSIEMRNVRTLERIEWRCMLDRDRKIPSPKAFCSGCMRTHDRSLFSIQSLTQPSTKRYCLGSAGQIWICPHRSLDYNQVREFLRNPRNGTRYEGKCIPMYGEFYYSCSFSSGSAGAFVTWWPIVKMPQKGLPSDQDVEEALCLLKAPLCPHLRLNDACVASAYLKDCASLQRGSCLPSRPDYASLMSPSKRVICTFCGIRIQFIRRTMFFPADALTLVTLRRLKVPLDGASWKCTDRGWICQVADPADIEEYEEAWHATNVECGRKVESAFHGPQF